MQDHLLQKEKAVISLESALKQTQLDLEDKKSDLAQVHEVKLLLEQVIFNLSFIETLEEANRRKIDSSEFARVSPTIGES